MTTEPTFAAYLNAHDRDQLDARAACAEQERDEARDDRDAARAELKEVRTDLDEAVSMLAQIGDAISPTGERPEEALGTLVADVQALVDQRDRLTADLALLRRELDGLRNDHRSALRANLELTAANARLRSQLGDATDAATVRRRLDQAITDGLPLAGSRIRGLLKALRRELELLDAKRAEQAARTGQTTPPVDIRDGSLHVGRAFTGTEIEDTCPCAQAPCGLVVQGTADPACQHHPTAQARTMRQIHHADQCPALAAPLTRPVGQDAAPVATWGETQVITSLRTGAAHPLMQKGAANLIERLVRERAAAPVPVAPAQETDVETADLLDGAAHSVWLHGRWRWLTKNMTTEEREAFADAVERYSAHLEPEDPATVDRWWRDTGEQAEG